MYKHFTTDTSILKDKALLSIPEACIMYSCGRDTMRNWAQENNAIRKYGARVFVIRSVMDSAILKQEASAK
jgi:hypothetical protein